MYSKYFVNIGQIVLTAMLAFYFPFLIFIPLSQQLYCLQAISMVYNVDSFHQVGTFLPIVNRIEQIHLKHGHADDITYDDS